MDAGSHFTKPHVVPLPGVAVRRGEKDRASVFLFRRAGLFDLSFIYHQIMEGCEEGAYSDAFLSLGGNAHLFRLLLLSLLPFGKSKLYQFHILRKGGDKIGYAGMYTSTQNIEPKGCMIIAFFGIARGYRRKRNGAQLMSRLVDSLPSDARVAAYTTRYSTCMHRLLASAGFRQAVGFAGCQQKVFLLDKRGAR